LKFRRRLETHDLCKGLFAAINADLAARGLLLREGTLADATLIAAPPAEAPKPADEKKPPLTTEPGPAPGGVSVGVDQIARPGAAVSGKVTFSDEQTAEWYLDQTGRLAVVPKQQGYKPSAADVQQFQAALQNELMRMGF
jgi:IS5 family transposase